MPLHTFGMGIGKYHSLRTLLDIAIPFTLIQNSTWIGGGCGVGLGLGWGFGSAFGCKYRSSKVTFQGIEFDNKGTRDKSVEDSSKHAQ